jgi:hypothetical protein
LLPLLRPLLMRGMQSERGDSLLIKDNNWDTAGLWLRD